MRSCFLWTLYQYIFLLVQYESAHFLKFLQTFSLLNSFFFFFNWGIIDLQYQFQMNNMPIKFFLRLYSYYRASPMAQQVKNPHLQCRRHRRHRFNSWVGEIPQRRKWQPTPVFLPGKFHGQRNLVGYSPKCREELDMSDIAHHMII